MPAKRTGRGSPQGTAALKARIAELEAALHAARGDGDRSADETQELEQHAVAPKDMEHYRRLVETMNEGAAILDFAGTVLYSNTRLANLLERPVERLIGSPLSEHVHSSSQPAFEALLERARTGRGTEELALVTSTGWRVPLHCSVTPFPSNEDQSAGLYLVALDVTELERNEEILSADRVAGSFLDQSAEAIVVCDPDARIIRASQTAHRLIGDNVLSRLFYEAFPFVEAVGEQDPLGHALKGESAPGVEVAFAGPSGEQHLLVSASPLWSVEDALLGCVVTLADITDRKSAEAERTKLFEAEQRARQRAEEGTRRIAELQRITAALADSISADAVAETAVRLGRQAISAPIAALYVSDPDGSLRLVANDSEIPFDFEPWTTLAPGSDLSDAQSASTRSPRWFESSKEYAARWPALNAMRATRSVKAFACIPMVGEGKTIGLIAFGFTHPRTFSDDERAFIQTYADQTAQSLERAWLLEAERSARAEAERANRIKDEFLATMSHELRTPLNAILGWAVTARAKSADSARILHALEVIERNARTQARLIDDLLDVSRIMSGKLPLHFEAVDLNTVIQAAADAIRPAAEVKGIALDVIAPIEELFVSGDPDRLQQIVWNLVSNAVKFTPRGGHVSVEGLRDGSNGVVQVRDSGQGILPELLPHIFERFRQADSSTTRAHGGLGLGLAIVRHFVELHGGTARVDSAGKGQGAVFTISLPIRAVARETPSSASMPTFEAQEVTVIAPLPSLEGLRILVVDDEEDAREVIREVLESSNAVVRTAASADEALRALNEFRPDVLLSDIGMPGTDGFELVRQIRALPVREGGRTPAVALTAYAGVEDARRVVAAGFQVHLAKPIDPAELVTVVANLACRTPKEANHSVRVPSGTNFSDTELMQYLSPVGLGPSSKT